MRRLLIKLGFAALTLAAVAYLPQLPGCARAFAPKDGRVVDPSGHGIPDVTIIAFAKLLDGSPMAAGQGIYRIMTKTNDNGEFHLPNTWGIAMDEDPIRPPWFRTRIHWLVTAIKPGFAFAGDDLVWSDYDERGNPRYLPPSTVDTPAASGNFFGMTIEPLSLRPVDFTVAQAADYYLAIFGIGALGHYVGDRRDDSGLRFKITHFLRPRVCDMNSSELMAERTVSALAILSLDEQRVLSKLQKLEPEGFDARSMTPVLVDSYTNYHFRAANVCVALNAAGEI